MCGYALRGHRGRRHATYRSAPRIPIDSYGNRSIGGRDRLWRRQGRGGRRHRYIQPVVHEQHVGVDDHELELWRGRRGQLRLHHCRDPQLRRLLGGVQKREHDLQQRRWNVEHHHGVQPHGLRWWMPDDVVSRYPNALVLRKQHARGRPDRVHEHGRDLRFPLSGSAGSSGSRRLLRGNTVLRFDVVPRPLFVGRGGGGRADALGEPRVFARDGVEIDLRKERREREMRQEVSPPP